jgi:hypothetical protein
MQGPSLRSVLSLASAAEQLQQHDEQSLHRQSAFLFRIRP